MNINVVISLQSLNPAGTNTPVLILNLLPHHSVADLLNASDHIYSSAKMARKYMPALLIVFSKSCQTKENSTMIFNEVLSLGITVKASEVIWA